MMKRRIGHHLGSRRLGQDERKALSGAMIGYKGKLAASSGRVCPRDNKEINPYVLEGVKEKERVKALHLGAR